MLEQRVSLASNGVVKVPGYEQLVRFGYTKNRGVYRLAVTASGEWEGLTIRAFWHVPDGFDPASSLVVDGYVDVPASVTAQSGNGCITFEGSDGAKTVTSADLRYRVSANSGTEDGTMPEPGTPAWQQLVEVVHIDATAAEQARKGAETAAARSESAADRAESAQQETENAKTDALAAIGTSKQEALDAVQEAQSGAIEAVQTAQHAATCAVSDAQTTAVNAVDAKEKEALANISTGIDPTLSVSGKAADAAKVGEAVNAESERAKGVESQLKEDIGDLSNALETDITQIKKKLAQSRFGDCVTILHFSDIHADRSALKQISEAIDNYNGNIDGSICTGDIVANSCGSISSWWNSKIMTCIGNHDSASYSSGIYDWTYLPMSERSKLYIEPFEAFWNVNHKQGTSYYYKDFADKKVRLIVIDTMLYMSDSTYSEASAQTVWLQTLLNTAKENGYHVIIATHAPNGLAKSMECSFSKYHTSERVMPIEKDCTLPNSIVDTVKTAIDGGLHFVGYICGHTHQDDIWVCAGDNRQLMYCIATSNVENINQWKDTDLWHGENCNAYNLVTINTSTKTLCLIRGGGANADKFVRERKMICFDYANAKLIR